MPGSIACVAMGCGVSSCRASPMPWQMHGGPFGDQSAEAAADRVGFLIREAIGGKPAAEI
jgi:hypothetical protein